MSTSGPGRPPHARVRSRRGGRHEQAHWKPDRSSGPVRGSERRPGRRPDTPAPAPTEAQPGSLLAVASVRAGSLPHLEAVRTGAPAVRWTRPVALPAGRQGVGPRIRSRAQPSRARVYGRRVPFPGGRFFLRPPSAPPGVSDGPNQLGHRLQKSHEHLMSTSGPGGSRRAKVRVDKEAVMNRRLGSLIAILVLSAAAEAAQAAKRPPSPLPGPCFNKKVQCRPLPAPCSPTSPSCRPSGGKGTTSR